MQWPAACVLAGFTLALFGVLPRLTAAGWGALLVCVLLAQVGQLLQLSHWAMDVSPLRTCPSCPRTR